MSSAVFGEDKLSEEVHELFNNAMGAISSLEKPMSPVLSSNKDTRKIIHGKRVQSRVNLATKFSEGHSTQSDETQKQLLGSIAKSKELPAGNSKNYENSVDKLNKVRDVEKQRKKCYSALSTHNIKIIRSSEQKTLDLNEKGNKKVANSGPKSKVNSNQMSGSIRTVRESKSKPLKVIKEPNQDINLKETVINIHIQGFKTATGKNIEISENALKKGTDVLNDILNPLEVLPEDKKTKLNMNKSNFTAHKINNPTPSRIKLSKNKVEVATLEKNRKVKSNSQKITPETSRIHKNTILKQSEDSELIRIENQTKYEKPEKLPFTQEGITDTQMNFVVDNIIPVIDVSQESNNSKITPVHNLSKNYARKCVNNTDLDATKSHYLPNEEFQISTQETNLLFSNFTQNIVNSCKTGELKQITENAIDNIYIAEDNFNASSSELLFKGFETIDSDLPAANANNKSKSRKSPFHGYDTIECLESSNRREVLKNMLTKLELDIKESFHKKLLYKYNREVKNIRKIERAKRDAAVNTEKTTIEERISNSIEKHAEIKEENSYIINSTRIKPNKNVEIEIKNNNVINININSNFNNAKIADANQSSVKTLEKPNLVTVNESMHRKRRFKHKTENIKKINEVTQETIQPADDFNCHHLQLGKSVKEALGCVKFNPNLQSNNVEAKQILGTTNIKSEESKLSKISKHEDDFEYSPDKKRVKSESGSNQKKIEKRNSNSGILRNTVKGNNNQMKSAFKSASGNVLLISEKTYRIAKQIYTDDENMTDKTNNENFLEPSGFKSAAGKVLKVSSGCFSKAKQMYEDIKSDLPLCQKVNANNLELVGKSSSDHATNLIKRVKRKRNNSNKARWENQLSQENIHKANTASLPSFQHLSKEKDVANPIPAINSISLSVNITKPESILPAPAYSKENNFTCQPSKINKTISGFQSASGKQLEYSNESFKKANKLYLNTDECNDLNSKTIFQPINCGFTSASGHTLTVSNDSYRKAQELFSDVDNEIQTNSLELSPRKENIFKISPKSTYTNINRDERNLISIKPKELPNIQLQPCVSYASNKNDKKAHEIIEDVVHAVDDVLASIEKKQLSRSTLMEKKSLGMTKFKQIEIPQENLERAKAIFDDCDASFSENNFKQSFTSLTMCVSTPTRKSNYKRFPGDHITPIKNISEKPKELLIRSNISLNEPEMCDLNDLEIELEKIRQNYLMLTKRKEALKNQNNLIEFGNANHRRQHQGYLYTKKTNRQEKTELKDVNYLYDYNFTDQRSKLLNSIIPKNAHHLHFDVKGEVTEDEGVIKTMDGAILIPNIKNKIGIKEIEMAFKAMSGVDPSLIPKAWISNHYKWIVWKLVSYERRFPKVSCLNVENVVQQLKYRYDREIDRAERSALRKILEKDDVPEKRMVLCVSDISQISEKQFEMELTDGWYALRTIIDIPLCTQILRKNIVIGTKLLIQGATIFNSEGCAPLEVPDFVRLKIGYNNTRKAAWDSKLGYQKVPYPLPIRIKSIHPYGGLICCLKLYIARVYPVKYLEDQDGKKAWRNDKAENVRRKKIEQEQETEIDRIIFNLQQEYKGYFNKQQPKHTKNITKQELYNINSPKELYEILESSLDPDNIMDMLSPSQRSIVLDYNQRIISEKQLELNEKINKKVNEFRGKNKRNVSPLLKLLVYDLEHNPQQGISFYIWRPTEDHLQILKEESSFIVYNIMPKKTNEIVSTARTSFKAIPNSPIKNLRRTLLPIAILMDDHYTPPYNEFDTVGIVIDTHRQRGYQEIWLADFVGRLLHVKIWFDASECLLIDCYEKGGMYSLSNLIYCKPQLSYASALGSHLTVISSYPEQKYLREAFDQFKSQLPQDLTLLIDNSVAKIDMCIIQDDIERCAKGEVELHFRNARSEAHDSWDEYEEDSTLIPSRLTSTDIAMSLINTQEYY